MHMSMRVTELGVGYSKVVANIGKKHMNPALSTEAYMLL
jgi:hypothetical protein